MKRSLYVSKLGSMLRDRRLPEDTRKRKRVLSPVAARIRIEHASALQASNHYGNDPFDVWMREHVDKRGLPIEIVKAMAEPYDLDAMKRVNERGGLRQLIRLMCPSLSAERQTMLYEKLCSLCHAKQRAHEIATAPALIVGDKDHRARRLSKSERRALREGKGRRIIK